MKRTIALSFTIPVENAKLIDDISLKSRITKSKLIRYIVQKYLNLYSTDNIIKDISSVSGAGFRKNKNLINEIHKETDEMNKEKDMIEIKFVDDNITILGE